MMKVKGPFSQFYFTSSNERVFVKINRLISKKCDNHAVCMFAEDPRWVYADFMLGKTFLLGFFIISWSFLCVFNYYCYFCTEK